jgi:myo-inositol catabolism protein IolC
MDRAGALPPGDAAGHGRHRQEYAGLIEDCVKLVEIARRGGRNSVGLIVLGRGAERGRVVHWLKTAASVPGFIGFAVGRTSFWQPLVDVEAKRISQEEAAIRIARNFEAWIRIFEETRSA